MVRVVRGICIAVAVIGLASGCAFDTTGPSTLAPTPHKDATSIVFWDGATEGMNVDLRGKDGGSDGKGRDLIADARSADTSGDMLAADISVDTLSPDATVDTLVRPDGWISDAVVSTCTSLYGHANNFQLCGADATSCTFGFNQGESYLRLTCNTLCGDGRCLGAHDDSDGIACVAESEPGCTFNRMPIDCSCTTNFHSGICICSR